MRCPHLRQPSFSRTAKHKLPPSAPASGSSAAHAAAGAPAPLTDATAAGAMATCPATLRMSAEAGPPASTAATGSCSDFCGQASAVCAGPAVWPSGRRRGMTMTQHATSVIPTSSVKTRVAQIDPPSAGTAAGPGVEWTASSPPPMLSSTRERSATAPSLGRLQSASL